jgi:hypothetical protein
MGQSSLMGGTQDDAGRGRNTSEAHTQAHTKESPAIY